MRARNSAFLLMVAFAIGCGGQKPAEQAATQEAGQPAMAEVSQAPAALEAPAGPIDAALATEGQGYFNTKGCVGCHSIGKGKMVGPDLKGATERREFNWFVAMVTNPDSMLKNDPTAQGLLKQYGTPMVAMGVAPAEARAIYEYLRQESQK